MNLQFDEMLGSGAQYEKIDEDDEDDQDSGDEDSHVKKLIIDSAAQDETDYGSMGYVDLETMQKVDCQQLKPDEQRGSGNIMNGGFQF